MKYEHNCKLIVTAYDAASDADKLNYWRWSNKAIFEAGYALRSDETTVKLPTLKPFRDGSSASENDFEECGPVRYVVNTDGNTADDTLFDFISL